MTIRRHARQPSASESDEQQSLLRWATLFTPRYPDLQWLAAIPNGGHRHKATAGRMKAEGVKAGYPDLLLDVARGGYFGLRIELKRQRKSDSRTSPRQVQWHDRLRGQGYRVEVCLGWEAARDVIVAYLALPKTEAA